MRLLLPMLVLFSQAVFSADPVIPSPGTPKAFKLMTDPPLTAGTPLSLDANHYCLAWVPDYAGKIKWRVSNESIVTRLSVKPGTEVPGWKQGTGKAAFAKAPESTSEIAWIGGEGKGLLSIEVWIVVEGDPTLLDTVKIAVSGATKPDDGISSEFQEKLQAAFVKDGGNVESAKKMAAMYRGAAKTTADDPGIKDGFGFKADLLVAVKALGITPGSMDNTARAIADEINPAFDSMKTSIDRAKVKAICLSISSALEALK